MELYIFRHGQKQKTGRYIGWTNVGLTPQGHKQNIKICKILKGIKVNKIYTSDLQRTFIPCGIEQKALREINFGLWEGLTWNQVEKKFPNDISSYFSNPLTFTFPKGESYPDVQKRVIAWLKKLKRRKYSRVGIVTHQGVIRTILYSIQGVDFWKQRIPQGKMVKKIVI